MLARLPRISEKPTDTWPSGLRGETTSHWSRAPDLWPDKGKIKSCSCGLGIQVHLVALPEKLPLLGVVPPWSVAPGLGPNRFEKSCMAGESPQLVKQLVAHCHGVGL